MSQEVLNWFIFNVFVLVMLALDLFVFNRKDHEIKINEAFLWSLFWIALALLFNAGVYFYKGHDPALRFLTGYVLEKSLSVDNLFVFLLVFSYFKVPHKYQHKVLFWGILGALVMRALFIMAGISLLHKFHWIVFVFGGFLVFTGIKLLLEKDKEIHPEKNIAIKLFKKIMPVTSDYEDGKMFVRRSGKLMATPLFVVLIVVETTDIVFAVDSIPAILAISTDPFIVYTSNVFAILGLRALYFALAGMMQMFHLLHYGLGAILIFIGTKMLLADIYHIPIGIALSVIMAILAVSIVASIILKPKKHNH